MNKDIKTKWLTALRSGKYQQTDGVLRSFKDIKDGEAFCCLGVLADIQGATWADYEPTLNGRRAAIADGLLAPFAAAGIWKSTQRHLADMNDDGLSFAEIADYVERRL